MRRSERIRIGVAAPDRLSLVTKIRESEWNKQEETSKAVKSELRQLFREEQHALQPVMAAPRGVSVLGSHMFVTEKRTATGEYDKTKARLVADGRMQDASLFPDKSSPTLAMQSLMTVLAMYAGMVGWQMAKVDIKGAFVQVPWKGETVYMRICSKIVTYLLEMYPEYAAEYVQ